jgi:hypothetical protein
MSKSYNLDRFSSRLREFISVCSPGKAEGKGIEDAGDSAFADMALELFAAQFELNGPYRKFCGARKASPGTIATWDEIPAISTSAFKELEVTCLPDQDRTTVFYSSGTTLQRPSRHFHSPTSLSIYEESAKRWFRKNVLHGSERIRMVSLTPGHAAASHSSLVHMFEVVMRDFGSADSAFVGDIGPDGTWTLEPLLALERLLGAQNTGKPVMVLGTAFSFVHLLDSMADQNLHFCLPPGSRVMETGGYKGRSRAMPKSELHSFISKRLGISPAGIICEYGMSELSSQAYASPQSDGGGRPLQRSADFPVRSESLYLRAATNCSYRFPPWTRARVVSPETGLEVGEGQTGLVQVFDLANVYSVLAVQTEDLAIRRGKGFELLGRAAVAESRGCSLMSA